MSRYPRIVANLTCVVLLSSLLGCATLYNPFAKKLPKATAADPAVQILCLWQQAEGRDPEGVPCKGFSGTIFFLSSRAATPVEIEGDIRIYLFDDQGTEEDQTKPFRIYNFDNGAWSVHLAETPLGATYSVFVPYTRKGIKDANCALRLRLKPKHGPVVFSDMSSMPLTLGTGIKRATGDDAKPISKEEAERFATESLTNKLRRTTTISMGSNPKTTESMVAAKSEPEGNQVQTASYQVVESSPKETAESDRIRQLEALVQQMREQKLASTETSETTPLPRRRRLKPAIDELQVEGSRPEELPMDPAPNAKRIDTSEPRRNPSRRRNHPLDRHPLDTEGQISHPLMDEHDLASEPKFGHPFESLDEQEETKPASKSQRDESDWADQ